MPAVSRPLWRRPGIRSAVSGRTVPSSGSRAYALPLGFAAGALAGTAVAGCAVSAVPFEEDAELWNWSGTAHTRAARLYAPRSEAEVLEVLRDAAARGRRVRPAGTGLSPNGLGHCDSGDDALSLSEMDSVLEVNTRAYTVTVQAGARVSTVLAALAEHDLTLENFSSVQEQQVAGWTQVAAHGTGASLPTVEEQIVSMRLATPARGVLELSSSQYPEVFRLARVGLGSLGVVTQLTLRCVPKHRLRESTWVWPASRVRSEHSSLLRRYRHVRYMWLPYEREVVVVASNPVDEGARRQEEEEEEEEEAAAPMPGPERVREMVELLRRARRARGVPDTDGDGAWTLTFAALRDRLLALDPLSVDHVREVNRAEAAYWRKSEGTRTADSTDVLGFDCGGPQHVLEVAFPAQRVRVGGDKRREECADIDFVEDVLGAIEAHNVPAPCPIEQRWTAGSSCPMSPSHAASAGDVTSWVGVIMYLPTEESREAVSEAFRRYVTVLEPVYARHGAVPHWAKLELPQHAASRKALLGRLRDKYPLREFRLLQRALDPEGVLRCERLDAVVGWSE